MAAFVQRMMFKIRSSFRPPSPNTAVLESQAEAATESGYASDNSQTPNAKAPSPVYSVYVLDVPAEHKQFGKRKMIRDNRKRFTDFKVKSVTWLENTWSHNQGHGTLLVEFDLKHKELATQFQKKGCKIEGQRYTYTCSWEHPRTTNTSNNDPAPGSNLAPSDGPNKRVANKEKSEEKLKEAEDAGPQIPKTPVVDSPTPERAEDNVHETTKGNVAGNPRDGSEDAHNATQGQASSENQAVSAPYQPSTPAARDEGSLSERPNGCDHSEGSQRQSHNPHQTVYHGNAMQRLAQYVEKKGTGGRLPGVATP